MIKEIIATGKDVAEAQATARQLLGASELDDVKFEIIYLGRKGFMGFGSKPAQVKAYIEIPDKEEKRRRPERQKREKSERPAHEKAQAAEATENTLLRISSEGIPKFSGPKATSSSTIVATS